MYIFCQHRVIKRLSSLQCMLLTSLSKSVDCTWINFWVLYSVSLIQVSMLMPGHAVLLLQFYSILGARYCKYLLQLYLLTVFAQGYFDYYRFSMVLGEFQHWSFLFYEAYHWYFMGISLNLCISLDNMDIWTTLFFPSMNMEYISFY